MAFLDQVDLAVQGRDEGFGFIGDVFRAAGGQERRHVPRHHVAHAQQARLREQHEGVAVRVPRAEVIELDPVIARADGHPVLVGLGRQQRRVRARAAAQLFLGAFVHHDAHVRVLLADVIVAADVVRVAVGVDDQLDRLVGDLLDLGQDRRTVAGHLGVDQDDPVLLHDHQRVPAAAEDLVDVAGDMLDRLGRRQPASARRAGGAGRRGTGSGLGLLRRSRCGEAGGRQNCQNSFRFHPVSPLTGVRFVPIVDSV